MTLPVAEAARHILVENQIAIISSRDLTGLLQRLYAGEFPELNVRTRKSNPSDNDIAQAIKRLKDARVVRDDPDFGSGFYQVFDVLEQSAETVCCEADPLCYVSHLAAMQLHGISERSPSELVFTRPSNQIWRDLILKVESNFGAPPIRAKPKKDFPKSVRGRSVLIHDSNHPGTSENISQKIRVSTLGQTFLDTVVRPAWCGGMTYVLEIWRREAEANLDEIVKYISQYPAKLPKVRAGFIIDELLGISDNRVLAWRSFAQRGSSQKLDPEQPYAPEFSENWMISINV